MTEAKTPALYSVREAMKRAGVPNWQMGGGVSSADAIDFIANQRDEARAECNAADQRVHGASHMRMALQTIGTLKIRPHEGGVCLCWDVYGFGTMLHAFPPINAASEDEAIDAAWTLARDLYTSIVTYRGGVRLEWKWQQMPNELQDYPALVSVVCACREQRLLATHSSSSTTPK